MSDAFLNMFYFGYPNRWLGYLSTSKAFEEGGYEPKDHRSPRRPSTKSCNQLHLYGQSRALTSTDKK